ncbi:MAG: hypothetical protein QOJ26_1520, partial [Thermoplasmata archaeon]|nr:hypothetical protein [Thermoplasmata archaeon]
MRLAIALCSLLVAAAGCLDAAVPDPAPATPDPEASPAASYPFGGMTEFCRDNETCDFWDQQFHEGAVYEMDTLVVEALVLPVPGADPMASTLTARMATATWQNVTGLAEPWFAQAFQLHTYAVGIDIPSAAAVTDPEIVVVSEAGQRSTSIGLNAEQVACSVVGGPQATADFVPGSLATKVYPVHEHDGMAVVAADCITGGFRCAAINFSGALGGSNSLYDLVAHEVGHCLGASHVGDALDFNARYVPVADIMAYADNPSRVSCPSSLNARVLEGIYAHLADQPVPDWLDGGGY